MNELEKAKRIDILYNKILNDRERERSDLDELSDLYINAGIEWQAEQSPWVSVEDRRPKDGARVWVRSHRFNNLPLFYVAGRFRTNQQGGYCDCSVTHWMEIPE